MSFLREISPLVKNTFLSEKDVISICAAQIAAEIQQVWYYFDNTIIFYSCIILISYFGANVSDVK